MTKKFIVVIFLMLLAVSCTSEEPPAIQNEPIEDNLVTPTLISPSPTVDDSEVLDVPVGDPPVIDGVISANEWGNAVKTTMSNGSDLYWLYAEDMLYLAVKSPELGAVNLAIQNEDTVRLLHSSAALGSAIYEKMEDGWHLTQNFSWCCRSTSNFGEMEALFQAEGWLASIGYLGVPGEVEFQVAVPEGEVRVAVSYMFADSSVSFWPEDLSESAVEQIEGFLNDLEDFHLDEWVELGFGE